MNTNITDYQASIFYRKLDKYEMTVQDFVDWAYAQYDDDGALPWIEQAALCYDIVEAKAILTDNFQIQFELDKSYLVGELADKLERNEISAYKAVWHLFYTLDDLDWTKEEETEIYTMEDYYGWHNNPDSVVIPRLKKLIDPFKKNYIESTSFLNVDI
ncbi:hypothetical protein [Pleionea sediminis]|uniref:hypothetical protein n=1 Tax=Pleionea sediminis TaxID=2569479 RepID=UPI0011847EE8|nr:hypothetical protein [Pleionea sediminis]